MKSLLTIVLALIVVVPAFAQEQVHRQAGQAATPRVTSRAQATTAPASEPGILHVTDVINSRPDVRAAIAAYERMVQENPHLAYSPAGKTAQVYDIGDTRKFKVYNYDQSGSSVVMDEIDFTLKAETDRFRLWVETAEINNGHVRDQDVEALRVALQERTPEGSIDPNAGIIVNDETVFGAPPDVDKDGKSDVLLLDIRDGWTPGNGYVAGFVWHADSRAPGTANSNSRDILYLDSYPGLYRNGGHVSTEGIEGTAAHEYQHLIHLAYDNSEASFVNEGLSEWAELVNGYNGRAITYLGNTEEHNRPFFGWRSDDINAVLNDYERAGLFTTYLAQRLGTAAAGSIVQAKRANGSTASGSDGYDVVLAAHGMNLNDVMVDFHTANFLNSQAFDANYGYTLAQRQNFAVIPSRRIDGKSSTSTQQLDHLINPGAVQYFTWTNVGDFSFRVDLLSSINDALKDFLRPRIRVRAILKHTDGTVEVRDFGAADAYREIAGDFKEVTLLMVYTSPSSTDGVRLDINAEWSSGGSSGVKTEAVRYDNGSSISGKFFTLGAQADGVLATRFSVPAGTQELAKVSIAPYFLNQFSDSEGPIGTPQDPRNITFKIWAATPDSLPGDEIVSFEMADPRAYFGVTSLGLNFFDVNLSAHADALASLPEMIFIGYGEAGADRNYMVAGPSTYTKENVSFVGNLGTGGWTPLWDVQFEGSGDDEFPVRNTVIPVRVEFLVSTNPVANEDPAELPEAVVLEQNYPNPFNPTTSVRFVLPQSAPVRLAVYDLLGRHVTTLVDGIEPAGAHEVRIDAARWASGVYVYVLETGGQRLTKKMLLVK